MPLAVASAVIPVSRIDKIYYKMAADITHQWLHKPARPAAILAESPSQVHASSNNTSLHAQGGAKPPDAMCSESQMTSSMSASQSDPLPLHSARAAAATGAEPLQAQAAQQHPAAGEPQA